MPITPEKKFSKEHEWLTIDGELATIGITKHAAEMLGDIVFVELPEKGENVKKGWTSRSSRIDKSC